MARDLQDKKEEDVNQEFNTGNLGVLVRGFTSPGRIK